jgi:hypothetical protein
MRGAANRGNLSSFAFFGRLVGPHFRQAEGPTKGAAASPLTPRSKDAPPLLAQLQPGSRAVAFWDHSDQVTREAWQAAIATSEERLQWDPDHAPNGSRWSGGQFSWD